MLFIALLKFFFKKILQKFKKILQKFVGSK